MTGEKTMVRQQARHVIMVASENDALRHGKVGGVGDVMRDLPNALARLGLRVTTIVPAYGILQKENPARSLGGVRFPFAGQAAEGEMWEVTAKAGSEREGVRHLVFEHPGVRGEPIYSNDPPGQAFARDAAKYALFCSAIGQYLRSVAGPFILHLHDWHTGYLFLLKELHPDFAHMADYRSVFTIHNLAIQGARPIRGRQSSVEQWFPELFGNAGWISAWKDPRFKDPVFTPMAAGIRFADRVNTVSPTYAEEILRPSDHARGFFGGEGLETLLRRAGSERRLFGILNGAEYPAGRSAPVMPFRELCELIVREVTKAREKKADPLFDEVIRRIVALGNGPRPEFMLTSVTRVVEQKIKILYEKSSRGTTAIDEILRMIGGREGIYLFLGTGTGDYEEKLAGSFARHGNFLFLKLYSEAIAQALYANGTIFMMPSSFEPCGIGQMIAMRDAQPCIVHATGGLRDTVLDGVNGFQFGGGTLVEQADNCIAATERGLRVALEGGPPWEAIRDAARAARFTWEQSASQYVELLYADGDSAAAAPSGN